MNDGTSATDWDALLRVYLRLTLAEGIGPVLFRRIIEHFGSVEAAVAAPSREILHVSGVGDKVLKAMEAVDEAMVEAEINQARRCGVGFVLDIDADYPAALRFLNDAPPVLYVRGQLIEADAVALAVVGSRRCTHYGAEQAGRFGALLGRAGYTVISGGARGIDAAAHLGALNAGGRTIAVMGCGLQRAYPPENAGLFDRIADGGGALVSEFPLRTGAHAGNFPRRNRLISGLAQGVLVVEAARRSGSLITASLAGEQGKSVFAVPGRVDSPYSRGANDLIADGAVLTQDLEDILDNLGELGRVSRAHAPDEAAELTPKPELDPTEQTIAAALAEGEKNLDQLVAATKLPAGRLAAALTVLTIKAVVKQRPGGIFTLKNT